MERLKPMSTLGAIFMGSLLAIPLAMANPQDQSQDQQAQQNQQSQQSQQNQTSQQFQQNYQQRREQNQQAGQNQQDQQAESTVVGYVITQQDIPQENGGVHRVVTLQDNRGETIIVDLGQPTQDMDVQHGDRIIASGPVATINGQPVLFAGFAGELADVGRVQPRQEQNQQQGELARKGERVVIGEIVDQRNVNLSEPAGASHRMVKLRNRQGETIIVDLGSDVQGVNLETGDRIVAAGKAARINGRPVLYARFAGQLNQMGPVQRGGQQMTQQRQQMQEHMAQQRQQAMERQQQAQAFQEQQRQARELQQQQRQFQPQGQQQMPQQQAQEQYRQGQPGQQQFQQGQPGQQQQRAQQQQAQQGERAVFGRVVDQQAVSIAETGETHQLVKLENQQGETIVVDLGEANQAMNVEPGDQLFAVGKNARINERPVLYARYAGELRTLPQGQEMQQQFRDQQQQNQQQNQQQQPQRRRAPNLQEQQPSQQ